MRRVPFRVAIWVVCLILTGACRGRPDGASPALSSPDPTGPRGTPRVIVVGGGIAGLVSAYELGKRGISTELLEATDSWGGRRIPQGEIWFALAPHSRFAPPVRVTTPLSAGGAVIRLTHWRRVMVDIQETPEGTTPNPPPAPTSTAAQP